MKTPVQAANDLLHVMTEVGQSDCYLEDMRLIISALNEQQSQIRLLAEAVLEAHNKIYTAKYHINCCDECQLALEIMEVEND